MLTHTSITVYWWKITTTFANADKGAKNKTRVSPKCRDSPEGNPKWEFLICNTEQLNLSIAKSLGSVDVSLRKELEAEKNQSFHRPRECPLTNPPMNFPSLLLHNPLLPAPQCFLQGSLMSRCLLCRKYKTST